MLKTNIKLWAIVVAVCLIGQFFIAAIPGWVEQGKQEAQIEIAKREEERLQSHEPGLKPIEVQPVVTEPIVEPDVIEGENASGMMETTEGSEDESDLKISPIAIVLLVFVIVAMIFVMFL